MRCPSCQSELRQYTYHGTEIDVCPKCNGVWFDAGELPEFVHNLLTDRPDIRPAPPEPDKKAIPPDLISEPVRSCPRCRTSMRKFHYASDSSIILDKCDPCGGIWCDGPEIGRLASVAKGYPKPDSLVQLSVEEQQKVSEWRNLTQTARDLAKFAPLMIFLPKIILPLKDDTQRHIRPWAVYSIVLINCLVFIGQALEVTSLSSFFAHYGLVASHIVAGNGYATFVSSMFLHSNVFHLVVNMLFFWIFADNVEEALGHWRFLGFYLLVGVCAGLLHVFVNMHSTAPMVGSSGAVAGAMGAYFVLYPRAHVKTLFIIRVYDIPAYVYLGVWIVFQGIYGAIVLAFGVHSGIAWFAHIGGFGAGVAYMLLHKAVHRMVSRESVWDAGQLRQ